MDRTVELRPLEPSPVNALARELMVKTRRYGPLSVHMVQGHANLCVGCEDVCWSGEHQGMGIGLFAMRRWHAAWRTTGPVASSGHHILSHWDLKAPATLSPFKWWDCF